MTSDPRDLAKKLKLDDGLGFMARVLAGRAASAYEELTGQTEITPQQFGVLLTLFQRGPMTLKEITRATRADQSTTGEMVRRMGARGLITRAAGEEDRRTVSIAITDEGATALVALVQQMPALQERMLAPIAPEHRRLFLENLKRLVEL